MRANNIPVITVVRPVDEPAPDGATMPAAVAADGVSCNSGFLDGLPTEEAIERAAEWFVEHNKGKKEVQFRLRDWLISRQRYWGTPIPMVYCDHCGVVPVPEEQLPVKLPLDIEMPANGGNPLALRPDWYNTTCPVCGGPARRETDTIDTFFCSSWYFDRYTSPWCKDKPFDKDDAAYWMTVDQYIGGIEHACLHLIYARFFTKVLSDSPASRRYARTVQEAPDAGHGHHDGAKMSKPIGNVVDPDDKKVWRDTARLFAFRGPWRKTSTGPSAESKGRTASSTRLAPCRAELEELKKASAERVAMDSLTLQAERDMKRVIHSALDRVTKDIRDERQFNTAVARLMELTNALISFAPEDAKGWSIKREGVETLLCCLSPFAPHITEELWHQMGNEDFLSVRRWFEVDGSALVADSAAVVLQINGKVREQFTVPAGLSKEEQLTRMSREATKKRLEGKEIVKTISVPGKLVNIVVKG
ncbi:MAG: class I tRNA ligase family protein [Cloacibacillus evryensis]